MLGSINITSQAAAEQHVQNFCVASKKTDPIGVLRGSAWVPNANNVYVYVEFYAWDYTTTEILGAYVDGDFWVTDGYFYTSGGNHYVLAAVDRPSPLYYDRPI